MVFSKLLKIKNGQSGKSKWAGMEKDLLERKGKLEEELKSLLSLEKDDILPSMGDDTDEDVQADQVEEIGNVMALREVMENDLKKVTTALEKIKEGRFGICENCGKEIKIKRLKVEPAAKFCVDCFEKKNSK